MSVSGPGYERDGLPTVDSGVSAALSAATRHDSGTWYVRVGGKGHYAVERQEGGTIYVTAMNGAAS